MKANELRIGNIVNISEDWYRRNPHLSKTPKQIIVDSINYDGLIGTSIYFANGYEIEDDLDPIPITEEWLLRLGFEKNNQSYQVVYTINVEDEYEQDYTSKLYLGLDGQYFIGIPYELFRGKSKIQYVHQLQNLYFALTGEELTIKEEK